MKKLLILLFISVSFASIAQQNTQTVRGTVLDQDTQAPLIGATIQIIDSNPIAGDITDVNGNFRISNVALGRISLAVTYIGYEDRVMSNVLVTSAKEIILNIPLRESIEKLEEITITATKNKAEVLNEMAMISARSFSVEETQRYAGALNDPARMVSSFAGVSGNAEGNNDIVVRGNSSKGILWKLEGVEIPNPNHFANDGATGGPVNALNSNMLSNSDFFSGAFAPEYGNSLSGVFDMKFKKGNNERREYTTSASIFGIDFTAEGPFAEGYRGSYIANYRYSSLQLLSDAGILDFGGVPKYQDASFKVDLPIGKKHVVSLFGLGGLSSIAVEEETDEGIRVYRGTQKANLGVAGLNHTFLISAKSYLKTFASVSATQLKESSDLPEGTDAYTNFYNNDNNKSTLRFGTTFNHKISAQHKLESGVIFSEYFYNGVTNYMNFETKNLERIFDDKGNTSSLQAFTSWKYRMSDEWTMTTGLHYLHFGLNNSQSIEPRLGFRWDVDKKNAFTIGTGIHSRLETVSIYLSKTTDDLGNVSTPNHDLKPAKAAHFVLGYDHTINPQTHLKIESYYQYLYDIPVESAPGSTVALLNQTQNFVNEPMNNQGTGRNYGLEFTLERYFNKGFYYMSTLSLYESFYTPIDGKERKTAFDGNYVFNLIGGKEFAVGPSTKSRVLFFNTKVALIGGSRYTPIDLEESNRLGTEVRKDDQPFSVKGDDIFFFNLAFGTRKNKKNTTSEVKLDISNLTNNKGTVNEYYVEATQKIEKSAQLPFLPNIVYTFKF
jgi:hypothetical protein